MVLHLWPCGAKFRLTSNLCLDVVSSLVEEVRCECGGVQLLNEDIYMAPSFDEFVRLVVLTSRGVSTKKEFVYDAVGFVKHQSGSCVTCLM